MYQIEEANAGIAIVSSEPDETRLDDEDMVHFLPQKSVKIKHTGYTGLAGFSYTKAMNILILIKQSLRYGVEAMYAFL